MFVASVRENSGGDFFLGWLPLNAPRKFDDMNLGTTAGEAEAAGCSASNDVAS